MTDQITPADRAVARPERRRRPNRPPTTRTVARPGLDSLARRSPRVALAAVAALVLGAFALPTGAGAAEVDRPLGGLNQLNVTAAPGEVNRLRVSDDGPGLVRIRDALALSESTSACDAVSSVEVRCTADRNTAIVVRLGDGDDRAEVASTLRVGVEGAEGRDTYAGGLAGPSNVLFLGGADLDTASYADATAPVTVRLGDGPGDGRTNDQDDVGDAERIIGSRFGDQLEASPAQPPRAAELDGASGNDILIGGGGRDVLVGGLGIDFLSSRGGVDRVVASDSDRDTIDCGADAPDEALISLAGESSTTACERIVAVRPPASTTQPATPVGALRLAPKALHAKAGQVARLRLSWRHPRSWRKLRRIELRLYRGDAQVGAVAIRPRGQRITADGAVALVGKPSHLTRKGKTVSARLALRLDRSLAGRRLRLEVEAIDTSGARQLERQAGSIRVSR
jgi:hypothetical protein